MPAVVRRVSVLAAAVTAAAMIVAPGADASPAEHTPPSRAEETSSWQSGFARLATDLRWQHPDDFLGSIIERDDAGSRGVLAFKADAVAFDRDAYGLDDAEIRLLENRGVSYAEVERTRERLYEVLRSGGAFQADYDTLTGEIVAETESEEAAREARAQTYESPVEVRVVDDVAVEPADDESPYPVDDDEACSTTYPDDVEMPDDGTTRLLRCLRGYEILRGVSDDDPDLDSTLTRGQSALFIARYLEAATGEAPPAGPRQFSDTVRDSAFGEAINRLATADVVRGTGDGQFTPERLVTTGEGVKLVYEALRNLDVDLDTSDADVPGPGDGGVFADAFNALANAGIIGTREGFDHPPARELTRSAFADMLVGAVAVADDADSFAADTDD